MPGDEVWIIGERRPTGEQKYYVSNLPEQRAMLFCPRNRARQDTLPANKVRKGGNHLRFAGAAACQRAKVRELSAPLKQVFYTELLLAF
ncbi:MAG: hypothetical protein JWR80_1399 [Bradyrhizobium sp.]|nr:hypothetical protein [Bradyrhizobium sp.]